VSSPEFRPSLIAGKADRAGSSGAWVSRSFDDHSPIGYPAVNLAEISNQLQFWVNAGGVDRVVTVVAEFQAPPVWGLLPHAWVADAEVVKHGRVVILPAHHAGLAFGVLAEFHRLPVRSDSHAW
jgi:hypothetical protein